MPCEHALMLKYFANRPGWKLSTASIGPPEGFEYFQYLLEFDA